MIKNSTLNKLNIRRNKKSIFYAIALAAILTFSIFAILPVAEAHTPPWQIPTYPYIHVSPNPIGVSQTAQIYIWLVNTFPGAAITNSIRFNGYKLSITAPDGTVTTQTFNNISTTSAQFTTFVPTQVGTYNLTFTFPGELYTWTGSEYTGDTFLPSSSSTILTVQTTQIPAPLSGTPLPTSYWTRPIYGENTNWWSISSNWLGIGAPNYGGWMNTGQDALSGPNTFMQVFPGDAIGSQTNHVMWTKSLQSGGIVGGNNFATTGQSYFDGSAYIIRYNNPIILDGMLYYTEPIGFSNTGYFQNPSSGPTVCVSLQTGKQIWSSTQVPPLFMGMLVDVQTVNEHGVSQPILIAQVPNFAAPSTTIWEGFDGDTGTPLFNVTNIPIYTEALHGSPYSPWIAGSARAMGPDGEYLDYVFANAGNATNPNWTLGQWNSTKLFLPPGSEAAAAPTFNAPTVGQTYTIDGGISEQSNPNCRYDWNISVPYLNTMKAPFIVVSAKYGDGILCMNGTMPSNGQNYLYGWVSSAPYTYFFVNLNASKGPVGSVLWWSTLQPPANNYTVVQGPVDWNTGVFMQDYKEATQWVGYSLTTGKYLWTAPPQTSLDYFGSTSEGTLPGAVAYGNLYSSAYGGIVYCYNDLTGKLLWTFGNGLYGSNNSTASVNWPYGDTPTQINAIGNGVVYTVTSAHTWTTPIYKGGMERAINATTGQQIWAISGVTMEFGEMSYAMADGYNTWFNGYDNQIYVVGRGPSATTVSAPQGGLTLGQPLVISGTVMDISTGTTQTQVAANFPNGVPCASDASMSSWMSYVYQQQPCPTNFTGVPVVLSVLDPNNNTYVIGTTTTNGHGTYGLMWTPPVPGLYTVTATFEGNNGYWGSSATAYFAVSSTAASAASPAPVTTPSPVPASSGQPTTAPTPTSNPTATTSPTTSPSPAPAPSQTSSTGVYVIIAAAIVIIIVAAAAAVILRRRRTK